MERFKQAWSDMLHEVSGFAKDGSDWFGHLPFEQQLGLGAGALLVGLLIVRSPVKAQAGGDFVKTLLFAGGLLMAFALGVDWLVEFTSGGARSLIN